MSDQPHNESQAQAAGGTSPGALGRIGRAGLALVAALCVFAWAWSADGGPPATVGRVNGLSVAGDIEGTYEEGLVFPIEVRAEAVDPADTGWRWHTNVPIDEVGQRMITDAFAYLAAASAGGKLKLPGDLLTGRRYEIDFVDADSVVAGDSAGAALAVAAYSVLTNTPVLDDVAVTGAVTRDGLVKSVGDIATKIDGVIRSHTGTMILPYENAKTTPEAMAEVVRKAFPRVRVVFATTMEQVFFHAFGPYGPDGDRYRAYSAEYGKGVQQLTDRQFEDAAATFSALAEQYPEDNTAVIWLANVKRAHLDDLVARARRELSFDDRRRAREFVLKAFEIWPDAPEVTELLRALSGEASEPSATPESVAPAAVRPETGSVAPGEGPVVAVWQARAPTEPTDAAWRAIGCRRIPFEAGDAGAPELQARIAAAYTESALCLLLAIRDGTEDREPPRWELGESGFHLAGGDDRFFVVWDQDIRTGADLFTRSPAMVGLSSRIEWGQGDVWHWRAGATDRQRCADDLYIGPEGLRGDVGRPPYVANLNKEATGPAFVADGRVGRYGEGVLSDQSVAELRGNPLGGRETFHQRCIRCHGPDAPADQAGVTTGLAVREGGSQQALRSKLEEAAHAQALTAVSPEDVIAYISVIPSVPGVICLDPSGSRASVRAASAYADGWWYVVLLRRLTTGAPDDLALHADGTYGLYVQVVDGTTGSEWRSRRVELAFGASGVQ
ncbi:MAG TPA: ethylbenzene dehydrogenase-related protein [Armatimonadota bacterium]|nr:ethylbenzene dehydrogenase-related protein [Armatimonadota bacterium]